MVVRTSSPYLKPFLHSVLVYILPLLATFFREWSLMNPTLRRMYVFCNIHAGISLQIDS